MKKKLIIIDGISVQGTTVSASLTIDGNKERLVTTMNESCLPYLSVDRIDAYVMGLMLFALKNGYDFKSELPITESLYYNLNFHYIDALLLGNSYLHRVTIDAPIIADIKDSDKRGAVVGTGISCGVDSLYTVATHSNGYGFIHDCDSYRINALCFFNVGAAMKSADEIDTDLSRGRLKLAQSFAQKYGYLFLKMQSNIHILINKYDPNGYSHVENHTFVALFCIFHLQYGVLKYYYSSGVSIAEFNINNKNDEELDSAYYDLFTLTMSSVNGMKLYSTGSTVGRLDKVKFLNSYPPAYKYLNVCVNKVNNDNTCFKCERTLLEIDAVGDVERFSSVFDVKYYKANIEKYMFALFKKAVLKKDHFYLEIYPYFKSRITIGMKAKCILSIIKNRVMILKNSIIGK